MKRTVFYVLALCTLFTAKLQSQSWTWDSPAHENDGQMKSCSDWNGNIYLYRDYYYSWYPYNTDTVKKINAAGQLVSYEVIPSNMQVFSIINGPDSSIYMGGNFSGTLTFQSNVYISQGNSDIWIARYNKAGVMQWFKTIHSKGEDYLGGLCISANNLVITGSAEDTLSMMGQVLPKSHGKDFFLSKTTLNGSVLGVKFATGTPTANITYSNSFSHGSECASDPAGNIYVLMTAYGKNQVDTFGVSNWGPYNDQQLRYIQLMKFNSGLQPVRKTLLEDCYFNCSAYSHLMVNTLGECYYKLDYSYGQSGNDDLWSRIYRLNNTGVATATYQLRPDRNSYIGDIKMDACDNIYFTGYYRTSSPFSPWLFALSVGRLNPSLTLNWLWHDTVSTNQVYGKSIAILGTNDCFINGILNDSLTLANAITTGSNGGSYFGRLSAPGGIPCALPVTTGIGAQKVISSPPLYPNPTTGTFKLPEGLINDLRVYSVTGERVHAEESDGRIDLGRNADGIYLVIYNAGAGMVTQKVILKH